MTRHYRLGLHLVELGQIAHSRMQLRQAAYPMLEELREVSGSTVHFSIADGVDVLQIERLESVRAIPLMVRARRRWPVHATSSAGPGTRANIDEFTETTSRAIEEVGRAERGKAIIILNPVDPPMIMRDTVFCAVPAAAAEPGPLQDKVTAAVHDMVTAVQGYVPGYTLRAEPQYDPPRTQWRGLARVAVFLEVRGRGDYLPDYAGNLDIITAAAARVGDLLASARLGRNAKQGVPA